MSPLYPFYALLSRMKFITRWSLMHAGRRESLSEHSLDTAVLAHALCLIAKNYTGTTLRPETVTAAALYHDAAEIMTGDLPTPVKYRSERIRSAYKELESESLQEMLQLLPPPISDDLAPYLTGSILTAEEHKILKAADRLSALIKCMEECRNGNREFESALAQQKKALAEMNCPEADYFMEHMLPCYSRNLDELTGRA